MHTINGCTAIGGFMWDAPSCHLQRFECCARSIVLALPRAPSVPRCPCRGRPVLLLLLGLSYARRFGASTHRGACADCMSAQPQSFIMHQAAALGRTAVVSALIAQGAPVDAADEHGTTPRHRAVTRGHIAAVAALIAGGARVDAADHYGRTALHMAIAIWLQQEGKQQQCQHSLQGVPQWMLPKVMAALR